MYIATYVYVATYVLYLLVICNCDDPLPHKSIIAPFLLSLCGCTLETTEVLTTRHIFVWLEDKHVIMECWCVVVVCYSYVLTWWSIEVVEGAIESVAAV